jgi:hypothetical protein
VVCVVSTHGLAGAFVYWLSSPSISANTTGITNTSPMLMTDHVLSHRLEMSWYVRSCRRFQTDGRQIGMREIREARSWNIWQEDQEVRNPESYRSG